MLASWKAVATRTKEFYFLLLLQWTAMIGVFVSLDMFLYYAFWELSLVPMAIAIAMFGRDRGPQAAIKFFLYTFIPSALFLVAMLWLYAKTGSFDYVVVRQASPGSLGVTPQALSWAALAFLVAFAVKVPVFPLHGWLGDVISEAPTAFAMVVAGKLGLYSILRFNLGLFPCPGEAVRALDDCARGDRTALRRARSARPEGHEAPGSLRHAERTQLLYPGHLQFRHRWHRWFGLPDPQP